MFLAPGSIGPFSLLSDKDLVVKYFFDETIFDRFDYFAFPLNSCTKTIVIHKEDLLNFIESSVLYRHIINLTKFTEVTKEMNCMKVISTS